MKFLPLALAAALLAVPATPVLAAAEPIGTASATCGVLTWGATNPTGDPIEVRLELDGVDTDVVPTMTVLPGHTATRFNAYSGSHHVGLRVAGELIFGEYLAGPFCGLVAKARGMCHALKWGADNGQPGPALLRLRIDGHFVRGLAVAAGASQRVLTRFRGHHRVTITTPDNIVLFDRVVRSHCS